MAEVAQQSIASRFTKLNKLVIGKATLGISNHHLADRDGLLDSLFALYDECNNDYMRKDKNIATFVDKYRGVMNELRLLRVRIDDFEVKKTIGRGQFGEVKLVHEKVTGHVYAMKILQKNETLTQQNAFYEEERDIMAKSKSRWITQLKYAFQDRVNLYLVMEFHPGGDMLSLLEQHDDIIEEDMARFYLAELVLAINSVHNMGYVHRDIKPDNILLDRTGHIKLADFGSASKLGPQKTVTSRMPAGTPDYIAPEVLMSVNDGSIAYGVECDWWSLGVVAYEMMLGITPFSDEKLAATYNNIMNFKDSLKFPEDTALSQLSLDLIRGLLQEASKRLGHDQLCKHSFFADINWNNIHKTVPPLIPSVASQDDTSNFNNFEPGTPRFRLTLEPKKEFNGKNLPFIGFTYTSLLGSGPDRMSLSVDTVDSSMNSSSQLISPDDDLVLKKEHGNLQQKVEMLEKSESLLNKKIKKLQEYLDKKDNDCKSLQAERDSLKVSAEQASVDVKMLRERLASEKQKFSSVEEKTKGMLLAIKKQYENKLNLVKLNSSPSLQLKEENSSLEKRLHDANAKVDKYKEDIHHLEEELLNSERLAVQYMKLLEVTKHKEPENLHSQVAEVKERLDEAEVEKTRLLNEIQQIEACQEKQKMELELAIKEKNDAINQVESLKNAILKLESQMTLMETNQMKENGKSVNFEGLIQEMEKKLDIKENNLKHLQEESLKKSEQIKELQNNINEMIKEMERKFDMKDKELKDLQDESLKKAEQFKLLQNQANEYLMLTDRQRHKIEDLLQKLEEISSLNKEHKCTVEEQKSMIEELQQKVETLNSMQSNVKMVKNENAKLMEEKVSLIQKENNGNEKKLNEKLDEAPQEGMSLEVKIEKLEAERDKLKNNLTTRWQKFRDLQLEIKEKENDISQLSVDLRIAQHEAKQAEDIVGTLRDSNRNLREKLNALEKETEKGIALEKTLKDRIAELEQKIGDENKQKHKFEVEMTKLEERNKYLEENLSSLKNELKNAEEEKKNILKEQKKLENMLVNHDSLEQALKTEIKEKVDEIKQYSKEEKKLKEKLADKESHCANLEKTLKTTRDACTIQDEQLMRFEDLVEIHVEKYNKANNEVISLKKEIEEMEKDIRTMQESLAKEKSKRIESEQLLLDYQEEMGIQQTYFESQMKIVQEQLDQEKELVVDLSDQCSFAKRQVSQLNVEADMLKKKAFFLEEELIQIKEEAARHITHITSLKDSNMQLTQNLEESLQKIDEKQSIIEELQSDLDSIQASHEDEKFKLQQTIKQQTKLIDHLQANMGRKRKGTSWWFGRSKEYKENTCIPLQWQDMENMLEKERSKNRHLQEQLNKSKAECLELYAQISHRDAAQKVATLSTVPVSPTSRAMHSALALSPTCSSSDGQSLLSPDLVSKEVFTQCQKPHKERMRHNIPHRFQEILCMRGTKCVACLDSIHFGRHASKCQECDIICHQKCGTSLPSTCGVPSGYVQHFASTLRSCPITGAQTLMQDNNTRGWVKVPRNVKQGWETRFMCLLGTTLYFFVEEVNQNTDLTTAIDKMELLHSDEEVLVSSAVSPTELIGTAQSDIPYVLKVESLPNANCRPSRCMYIMAMSFEDKQMWVSNIESVINSFQDNEEGQKSDSKLYGVTILKLEGCNTLDINCCCELSETVLLIGAMEGLFVVDLIAATTDSLKTSIGGIKSVFQIAVLKEINIVIMITGENHELKTFDLSSLSSLAEGKTHGNEIQAASINGISSCHLFAVQQISDANMPYLCAATSDKLFYWQWNTSTNEFCNQKEVHTQEPCSCFHFSCDTLIYGADKFYEMELKTNNVKDFLDASDKSLAYLIYGASQLHSFPIAIFKVSSSSQQYNEFILCFHEMGVFVDYLGQRTRPDMKWTRLPLAFAYHAPHLFVIHFNSVEVIKISDEESQIRYCAFMDLSNPRYLGPASSNSAIYVSSSHNQVVELLYVQGNVTSRFHGDQKDEKDSLTKTSLGMDGSNGSGGGDFSFSSAMQSLESPEHDLSLSFRTSTDNGSSIL